MDRWNYRKVLLDTPRLVSVKSLVSAFDMVRDADFAFDGEMHDFWEMVYIASGKAGITADERVFTLNAGQLVFHKPMEFHRICSVGGAGHRALIMAFAAAGEELQELEDRIIELDEELEQQLHKVVDKGATILEMENNGLADTGEYREAAQEFVLLTELFLMRIIKGAGTTRGRVRTAKETYRMIARVLNENAEKFKLPEIAALCHMSVSNLKNIPPVLGQRGDEAFHPHQDTQGNQTAG